MSYAPTEWESTDVVTATRMNALEQAVGDMNMSYTPNTWSDGDILSAEKMNALEQAVASGGGGSSDFSTAQVTVVNNTIDPISGIYVCVNDGAPFSAVVPRNTFFTGSEACNVPLYKGVCYWAITDNYVTVSVSGDVEWDSEYGALLITGDGTITIS